MTPDSNNKLSPQALDDELVSQYLIDNPEFFNRQAELLLKLSIPHESGAAISLLERQVALFRERNRDLQNNINDFIFNAEENDALFEKTRIVILELLKTTSVEELGAVIEGSLAEEFSAHASRLIFITDHQVDGNSFRALSVEKARETLGKLFDKKRTFCFEISPEQGKVLFPDTTKEILSAAVIPVHLSEDLREAKGIGMPILVIGSDKHNHFNSSLDTLFLDFIGEILAVHITRLIG